MSTISSRPMSLVHVEFDELYQRHLCRHSQLGVNVAHLAALFGVWFGVYGFLYWQTVHLVSHFHLGLDPAWLPVAMTALYLAIVAVSAPVRVIVATAVFLASFLAAVLLLLPELPFWLYLLMIPVFYKLQAWSHKLFNTERDMTEFNRKYAKGFVLFVVLLIFEVPVVLNYLLFGRKDWAA